MIRCCGCREPVADLAAPCPACGWAAPAAPGGYLDLVPTGGAADGAFAAHDCDRLASTEDQSFWFRARNRLLLRAVEAEFPAASSLLEVGCGTGYVLAGFAGRPRPRLRLAGCDLSEAGLARARDRLPDALLLRADACDLPFDAEFDVVGAFDVLEHVPDDRGALAALARAARVGGGVVLTVPQHPWLWSETDRYAGHQRRYTGRELAEKLAAAGLRVRWMTSFMTLLLPAMAVSRAWQLVSRRPFDPSRELALPAGLDRLLERVTGAELALIAAGARLPVGGSLLAVAERVA